MALQQDWNFVTEVIKREIVSNLGLRVALRSMVSAPINDQYPGQFMKMAAQGSERVRRFLQRYDHTLGQVLALPPVPEEYFRPDLKHYTFLHEPAGYLAMCKQMGDSEEKAWETIESLRNNGTFTSGLVSSEVRLTGLRYRWARDCKILAFAAELLENSEGKIAGQGTYELPSGIKVTPVSKDREVINNLLSPLLWEKRVQLKDRVYIIEVNQKKYVLKERKTNRHYDTKSSGHITSQNSLSEALIAQKFQEEGTVIQEGVKVGWERPLGVVEFPDGFSFALFEYEEGLVESNQLFSRLQAALVQRKDEVLPLYGEIKKKLRGYEDSALIKRRGGIRQKKNWKNVFGQPKLQELSFEEFVEVYSYFLRSISSLILLGIPYDLGYRNSDLDGYAYRISTEKDEPYFLEILGFDFEYFSQAQDDIHEKGNETIQFYINDHRQNGIRISNLGSDRGVSTVQQATYLALLDQSELFQKS